LTIGDLRTVDEATRHGLPSAAKGRNQMNLCGRVIQTRQITMWHKPDGSGEPSRTDSENLVDRFQCQQEFFTNS